MNKSKLYRKLTIFGLVIYIILLAAILVIRKVDGELFDYVRWPFLYFHLSLPA